MQISINSLKARFLAGDKPSPKDFVDLIDTLLAERNNSFAHRTIPMDAFNSLGIADAVYQTDADGNTILGPVMLGAVGGDGSLAGAYPNLSIAPNGVLQAHMGIGAVGSHNIDMSGAVPGYVITALGSNWTWASPNTGANLTRVSASGAVRRYQSELIALPANAAAAATFAHTFAHNLNLVPDTFRAVLVCTASGGSAGYPVNKEVPVELFTGLNGKPVFFVTVDGTSVYVKTAFLASGSDYVMTAYSGDVSMAVGSNVLLTCPATGSGDFSNWSLRVYADAYLVGDGFGNVVDWNSTPVALNTVVSGTPYSITNTNAIVPSSYEAVAICTAANAGFTAGQEVQLSELVTTGSVPAFTLGTSIAAFNIASIGTLTTNSNVHVGSATGTAIDFTKWAIQVRALIALGYSANILQPPLSVQMANAASALTYGGSIFVAHGRPGYSYTGGTDVDAVLATTYNPMLSSLNLSNGAVSYNVNSTAFAATTSGPLNTRAAGAMQLSVVKWPISGKIAMMWIRGYAAQVSASAYASFGGNYVSEIEYVLPDSIATAGVNLSSLAVVQPTSTSWHGLIQSRPSVFPQNCAIVDVDDSTTNPAKPDLYIMASGYNPLPATSACNTIDNCYVAKLVSTTGPTYMFGNHDVSKAVNFVGDPIVNLASHPLFSRSGPGPTGDYIMMARYNPVLKRFYIIESATKMLHIYSLAVTLKSWFTTAGSGNLDLNKLTYVSSHVLPCNAIGEVNTAIEVASSKTICWSVEFDLTTGSEIALCAVLGDNILRIPWVFS